MKLYKPLFLALIALFSVQQLMAQKIDVTAEEEKQETEEISRNLDSLLNLWYLKNTIPAKNKKSVNIRGYRPDEVPTFNDSVYYARIKRIQSPLPYTYNSRVKAFIDLYAVRKREQVEKMLGLSEYYFPIFEEILHKNNMPLEIKYLSVVESALNPRAVSRVGATGLWQFMYATGKLYRLDVTSYTDDRKDPYKSSEAAARYLKDLHNVFGDWFLAIAAYNCGPGNVNKAIRRSGGKRTFWEIYNYLPAETRGYVPAFIAASYVFMYHQEHNLYPEQSQFMTMMVDTIMIEKEISFEPICKVLDVDIETLRDLNPHFKKDFVPAVDGKPVPLRLPATKAYAYASLQDSVYFAYWYPNGHPVVASTDGAVGPDGSVAENSTPAVTPPAREEEDSNEPVRVTYTVKSGDNIGHIADWYDVTIYSVRRWNGLRGNTIYPGQKLKLYVPEDRMDYYKRINTMSAAQKRGLINTNYEAVVAKNGAPTPVRPAATTSSGDVITYTVQRGDTLWSIAQRYPGVSVDDIKRLNGINGNVLKPGQKIKINKS